jgi:2',3'-cyclic-nucleotide 2'-phosphodiesterase (5'-nucleotidase family)
MRLGVRLFIVFFSAAAAAAPYPLQDGEKLITLLATNDIHGGIEPAIDKTGAQVGGFANWGGIVRAIRQGVRQEYGADRAGVLLLDGGDQFQGTLISNYNEGALVIGLMKQIGYDALIPGNHDFDFGPKGWLIDQSNDPTKRREVLESLIAGLGAPMLAANDYYRTYQGVTADENCKPTPAAKGEWQPVRPSIFQPARVLTTAGGVRVAVIGMDNFKTPVMTTEDNVADLCFADEVATYRSVQDSLNGKADIFVLLVHEGDATTDHTATKLTTALLATSGIRLDAVISAHTHFTYNRKVQGIPVIQSGANGLAFGRVDLIWNEKTKQVVRRNAAAGVKIYPDRCDSWAKDFCREANGKPIYDGVEFSVDTDVQATVQQERKRIDRELAKTKLGETDQEMPSNRIDESPAMDFFSDALLASANAFLSQHPTAAVSKVDVAFYNTGGLRTSLPQGTVTYEDLFRVLPFNNHGLVLGPMPVSKILDLLRNSIKTCGSYGAVLPSGLRVSFTRDCGDGSAEKPTDPNAQLVSVTTSDGKALFPGTPQADTLVVATIDFLAAGGEGGQAFAGVPTLWDFGIAREAIKALYEDHPFHASGTTDGRWQPVSPPASR